MLYVEDQPTFGACWILGFCKNLVISDFSALKRCKQTDISQQINWCIYALQT